MASVIEAEEPFHFIRNTGLRGYHESTGTAEWAQGLGKQLERV
jgi:hypothetical protein